MHMVGTGITMWLNTIINEAIDDYVHKVSEMNVTDAHNVLFREQVEHQMHCQNKSIVSLQSKTLPYLYPFTIEFNIVMASIWYIIWTNIGELDHFFCKDSLD